MAIYFFIAIFVFITSFCYSHGREKYLAANMKLLCFLCMFIPAAIRMGIGSDYGSYVSIFNHLAHGYAIKQEIGWKLLNLFVIKNDLPVQWIFVISSFLTYLFLFFTKKKDAWIVLLIYFLYLYTTSYNAVRNAISITIFWYSYICLCREKRLRGFVFVLISAMFHSSSYLYVPLYAAMCFFRINKRTTLCIAVVGYILLTKLHFAQRIMESSVFSMLRYASYVASKQYNVATEVNSGLGILLRHFYIFLVYCLCDEKNYSRKEFSSLSILFLSLLFSDILATQIFIFYRLRDCFVVAYMAIFSCLFRHRSRNAFYTVGKGFCLANAIILVFVSGLLHNSNEIIPYTNIFGGGV